MPLISKCNRAARFACASGTLRYNGPVRCGRSAILIWIGYGMRSVPMMDARLGHRGTHRTSVSGPVAQWQSTGLITPGSQVRSLPGSPHLDVTAGYSGVVCVI